MRRALVLAAAATVMLSACTNSAGETPAASSASAVSDPSGSAVPSPSASPAVTGSVDPEAARADAAEGRIDEAWTWKGRPVSSVRHEGDRVLFYALGSGGREQVVALDAATGAQVWAKGKIARTMAPIQDPYYSQALNRAPVVIDDVVYFAQQVGKDRGRQAAIGVDMETGREVVRSAPSPGYIGGMYACEEEDAEVPCFYAWDQNDDRQLYELKPDGSWSLWRKTGDYLEVDTDTRALVSYEAGEKVWTLPLNTVSDAITKKSRFIWSFDQIEGDDKDVVILTLLPIPPAFVTPGGTVAKIDYTRAVTVGVDGTTGEVMWRRDGVGYCPNPRTQPADPADPEGPQVALRCEVTGTVSSSPFRSNATITARTSDDFSVNLLRLDPLTGADLWSVDLGSSPMIGKAPIAQIGETTDMRASDTEQAFSVLEDEAVTLTIVDLLTGATRKATASDRFTCQQPEKATTSFPWYVNNVADTTLPYWTGYPCSWPGRPAVDGDFRKALLSADAEDVAPFVFSGPGSVTAYDWVKETTS